MRPCSGHEGSRDTEPDGAPCHRAACPPHDGAWCGAHPLGRAAVWWPDIPFAFNERTRMSTGTVAALSARASPPGVISLNFISRTAVRFGRTNLRQGMTKGCASWALGRLGCRLAAASPSESLLVPVRSDDQMQQSQPHERLLVRKNVFKSRRPRLTLLHGCCTGGTEDPSHLQTLGVFHCEHRTGLPADGGGGLSDGLRRLRHLAIIFAIDGVCSPISVIGPGDPGIAAPFLLRRIRHLHRFCRHCRRHPAPATGVACRRGMVLPTQP